MKAKLEFDLDDFDDRQAHMRCVKALDLCLLLYDLDNILRGWIKHAPDDAIEAELKVTEEVRDTLFQLKEKYSIDLDELIT